MAIGQAQQAAALYLQKEEFNRVRRPGDDRNLAVKRPVHDLRPFVVGDEVAAFVIPAERRAARPFAFVNGVGPCPDKVVRIGVDRNLVSRRAGAAAEDFGFVIPGGKSASIADDCGFELALEESSRIARPVRRRAARGLPVHPTGQSARIVAIKNFCARPFKSGQCRLGIEGRERHGLDRRTGRQSGGESGVGRQRLRRFHDADILRRACVGNGGASGKAYGCGQPGENTHGSCYPCSRISLRRFRREPSWDRGHPHCA